MTDDVLAGISLPHDDVIVFVENGIVMIMDAETGEIYWIERVH